MLAAAAGDCLAAIPELARYRCFVSVGHWRGAAAHDLLGLKVGVAKGTRTLLVYDRGGIDLAFFGQYRRECAL